MSTNQIKAEQLARMFVAGALKLEAEKEEINELNVFPVPDGDTGTNMTLTIMSAVEAVRGIPESEMDMQHLAKAISGGSLRGARGNSGVILSQLCRGFTKVIRDHDVVTVPMVAEASARAVETAYKAVMKPKEGTILTVARGVADKVAELAGKSDLTVEEMFEQTLAHGEEVLARTPEMLPVLKEAGVVDSGGKGLLSFLRGAYLGLTGDLDEEKLRASASSATAADAVALSGSEADIRFGYCTEFIINRDAPLSETETDKFRSYLMSIGDSLVLVADEDLVKIHVHTNDPGEAITRALTYGSLTNLKIDNMRFEHHEKLIRDAEKLAKEQEKQASAPKKANGFISVCAGDGFATLFADLGVDHVISGGQTMNPSTEDLLEAIGAINAEVIYLLPNNSNIILAANQARELTKDKEIVVVPTRTVPQGITAMLNFDAARSAEENAQAMAEAIGLVRTSQVTYAVRDTSVDHLEIHKDDIMAVGDEGILCVGSDITDVAVRSVESLMSEDAGLVSIYYGEGFSAEQAQAVAGAIEEAHPFVEVVVNAGGQPVYYCILSVE